MYFSELMVILIKSTTFVFSHDSDEEMNVSYSLFHCCVTIA